MKKLITILFFSVFVFSPAFTQEDIWEEMLREEVEVENPVYLPVIGIGTGVLNYFGDVNDNFRNPIGGKLAIKVNVSTFVDNKHYFKANFFLLNGKLTGNERLTDRNLNFETGIISFGINIDYGFGHLFKGAKRIRPFISAGIETMQFNSKADLYDKQGMEYYYWSDGTIRNLPDFPANQLGSIILQRDFKYETDLRDLNLYGFGNYSQNAFAVPVDFGLDFFISDRVTMRLGSSLHFTFTDYLDNVSYGGVGVVGNERNDMFSYSYVTFHLDLFSDPKTIIIEKLFAEVDDFDYTMYEDEDNDMVFDGWDDCPDTPLRVKVDSVGCPLDDDFDGVPNYLDKEKNTTPNAYVNSEGVEIAEEELITLLSGNLAVNRDEIDIYIQNIIGFSKYSGMTNLEIPEKFKPLDINRDGYISFDEVLKSIDDFFDFKSSLTTADIYELNSFFFAQ